MKMMHNNIVRECTKKSDEDGPWDEEERLCQPTCIIYRQKRGYDRGNGM